MQQYETVIGLEVHAQLKTKTKAFCACANQFGDSPNSNVCPVCLGLPGALPVLNERVVELAMTAGLSLGCLIQKKSIFARKNYFYPDMPKNYQISQYDQPICTNGYLDIAIDGVTRRIGIHRIHIEEDAGKLVHQGAAAIDGATASLVDLNRASTPLIEIVSEPEIRSAKEARLYMETLKQILEYLDVCDGNLEEGSLRCDANISIRPKGDTQLGTRTEIKNLNSFRSVERAIIGEIERQISLVESGGTVIQQTRHYDDASQTTRALRSKEDSHDYRYFPEPDLLPLIISDEWISKIQSVLPELPRVKLDRYIQYGLSELDAQTLINDLDMNRFFEDCLLLAPPIDKKELCKWVIGDVNYHNHQNKILFRESPITPKRLIRLIELIQAKTLSGKMAKEMLVKIIETQKDPDELIIVMGSAQISDSTELNQMIEKVIQENPDIIEKIKSGKTNSVNFLIGQLMRLTQGRANPDMVQALLLKTILQK